MKRLFFFSVLLCGLVSFNAIAADCIVNHYVSGKGGKVTTTTEKINVTFPLVDLIDGCATVLELSQVKASRFLWLEMYNAVEEYPCEYKPIDKKQSEKDSPKVDIISCKLK